MRIIPVASFSCPCLTPEALDRTHGEKIFQRSDTTWWLTGFKPGIISEPEELAMENIRITLKNQEMRDAFLAALIKLGYNFQPDKIVLEGNTIGFNFTSPKSRQPWDGEKRKIPQAINKKWVGLYNSTKKIINARDDSPATIKQIIEELN